jgi:hypothetical protein
MHKKSVLGIILSKIIGLVLFVLIVWLANFLIPFIHSALYEEIVSFVNTNIWFMIVMSIIFSIGEIFFELPFPINLPAPLFTSVASIFLVTFIGRIFGLAESLANVDITGAFTIFSFIIYPVVFFAVFIGGYITIFVELFSGNAHSEKHTKAREGKRARTWGDVGEEFKNAVFDFFAMMRRAFNKK